MDGKTIKQYGDFRLLDIECPEPYDFGEEDATHIRVSIPPTCDNAVKMRERGFFLADRTIDATINLIKSDIDYGRFIRTEPLIVSNRKDEVMEIARQSFPTDRRFNISCRPDLSIAETVLSGWVSELKQYYLCEIKGRAVGFLALTGEGKENRFIHLAAVLERYRPTGAGISLYAAAARDSQNAGIRFLTGRISTSNTAVMNLYTHLGASFSNPLDVYLKENKTL